MAIVVSCRCGRDFLTDDDNAGRQARCAQCQRLLDVPTEHLPHADRALALDLIAARFSRKAIASFVLGASSLFLMFLAGLPAVGLGIAAIADIRRHRGRLQGVRMAMAGVALGAVGSTAMSGFWIPRTVNYAQAWALRSQCAKNLEELYRASWAYQHSDETCPAAAICDEKGRPLLSWRVAILPNLGPEGEALYKKFHLMESWDSPHNLALLDKMPAVFHCPGLRDTRPGMTTYQLLVGPGTVFDGRQPLEWKVFDTKKRKRFPVLVVEADKPVPWTAPVDVPFDPDDPLAMRGDHHAGCYHTVNIYGQVGVRKWIEPDPDQLPTTTPAPASKTNSPAKSGGM